MTEAVWIVHVLIHLIDSLRVITGPCRCFGLRSVIENGASLVIIIAVDVIVATWIVCISLLRARPARKETLHLQI